MRLAPLALADVTEKELMAQGAELAKTLGWMRFHPYRSDRSEPGWPDDCYVRERLLFVEWKTERGKLSEAQRRWLRALLDAGQEAYVVRPRDLDALARILAARYRHYPGKVADAYSEGAELRMALRAEVG